VRWFRLLKGVWPLDQTAQVQAQYWQDPLDQAAYLAGNIFLPDINNALPTKNNTYKANLASLNAFVMVKFTQVHAHCPNAARIVFLYSYILIFTMFFYILLLYLLLRFILMFDLDCCLGFDGAAARE
jgi:hypothetical protein